MAFPLMTLMFTAAPANAQKFRHIKRTQQSKQTAISVHKSTEPVDTVPEITVERLMGKAYVPAKPFNSVNFALGPRVFSGYRHMKSKVFSGIVLKPDFKLVPDTAFTNVPDSLIMPVALGIMSRADAIKAMPSSTPPLPLPEIFTPETASGVNSEHTDSIGLPEIKIHNGFPDGASEVTCDIDITSEDVTPTWLRNALTANRMQEDLLYIRMLEHPDWIQYTDWTLPKPPRLPEDDINFASYIRGLDLPDIDVAKAILPDEELRKRHWLHIFQGALQFSQAYVSSTWYQGGNNHLSLLFNVLWDVSLNRVHHPNLMFQNVISYKLGLNSMPSGSLHPYSISEDIFQWNMQAGFKAFTNWFYSVTAQFKTQMLCNYEENSWTRTASFLSPGSLSIGVGMTYNKENAKKTFKISASISPIAYNLATVIDSKVNPVPYKVEPPRKTKSEIGSNAEVNINWKLHSNISYRTRLWLFSDYKTFLGDWENTFDFAINRFLSTQIYVHLRYDSASALNGSKWGHWMLKEILSFGLSYRFSTK